MLLKGCSRRVIMVRDTKSPYFDSVYFILRSDLPGNTREGDMLRAAKALIEPELLPRKAEQDRTKPRRTKRTDTLCAFFAGAATVALGIGIITLAAWLLY